MNFVSTELLSEMVYGTSAHKEFWAECDALMPCPGCGCEESKRYVEHFENNLVTSKGHPNSSQFANKSGPATYSSSPASYSPGSQNHNQVLFNNKGGSYSTNNFKQRKNQLYCDYCNFKGHTREICYKLNVYPSDIKSKKKYSSANSADYTGENQSNTAKLYRCLKKEVRIVAQPWQHVWHTSIFPEDKPKWIIDTGASNHIVHRIDILFDLKHLGQSKVGKVCLPTGDLATDHFSEQVKGIGKEDNGLYVLTSESKIQEIDGSSTTTNSSFIPRSLTVNTTNFDIIHVDVWGPYRVPTYDGKRYFLTIVDVHSRFTWLYMLPSKAEVIVILRNFFSMVKTIHSSTVKVLRTDNGKTPYEVMHGDHASLTHLKVFGCLGYVSEVRRTDKFAPRIVPAVFLGYFVVQKGYKMNRLASREFIVSRDVVFKEVVSPFKHTTSPIVTTQNSTSRDDT
ncbi:uncharacterized protein [Nicotiana tomentosiformis]|uniref:uncharacterized protein n=1 Tax=Nicotiana tomentosiformis TaxID=4098 RepID=UPI00388C94C3